MISSTSTTRSSNHYGVNCEYEYPCSQLSLNQHTSAFPILELGWYRPPGVYDLLTLNEGSSKEDRSLQVNYRPVYWAVEKDNSTNYLMFFSGRRWVIIDAVIDGKYLDNKTVAVDYLDSEFDSTASQYTPLFASDPMDMGTPTNQETPSKMTWHRLRRIGQDDDTVATWWEPAEDEPLDSVLRCAFCDNRENPCENEGFCDRTRGPDDPHLGVCECQPGVQGSLCEVDPGCNAPSPDDATIDMGCPFEAINETSSCTPSGKCTPCPVGWTGTRCTIWIGCDVMKHYMTAPSDWNGCFRGGECQDDGTCSCPEGYGGEYSHLCQFPNATEAAFDADFEVVWAY